MKAFLRTFHEKSFSLAFVMKLTPLILCSGLKAEEINKVKLTGPSF